MGQDVVRANSVTPLDVAHERNHTVDLRRRKRLVWFLWVVTVAEIDDLDTHRASIERGDSLPIARTRVPRPPVFGNQSVDPGGIAIHEVMAADLFAGQTMQRALELYLRIVNDDELDSAVLAHRLVSRIASRSRRASGERGQDAERKSPAPSHTRPRRCILFLAHLATFSGRERAFDATALRERGVQWNRI